jgi:hypothetical protein
MAVQRPREMRQPVRIGLRLRCARGWGDAVIRSFSAVAAGSAHDAIARPLNEITHELATEGRR